MVLKYPPPIKLPQKPAIQRSILKVLGNGEVHDVSDVRDRVAQDLKLTRAALSRRYKGGDNAYEKLMNRILMETKDEGLIHSPRKGFYQLAISAYRKWLVDELARIEELMRDD